MAKIISFFNHKGGVGKTTSAFHIGWRIAEGGRKVLLIDADPQCNLTGLALGTEDYDSLFQLYTSEKPNNLYSCLKLFFEGKTSEVSQVENIESTKNPNLYILPGHVDIATFDDEISTALKIARPDNMPRLQPLVGMFNNLIRKTAAFHNIDVVIVDMSPSISATNKCLLMGSDYFIVPTAPDFFSHQAIDSLSKVLPKWPESLKWFKNDVILPRNNPKMLGTLLQNYRRYDRDGTKGMASAFSKRAGKIREITNDKLINSLSNISKDNGGSMVIDKSVFEGSVKHDKPYNIGEIQNFNTLIARSQEYSMPIFALTATELSQWGGDVLQKGLDNVEEAKKRYIDITESVIKMIF